MAAVRVLDIFLTLTVLSFYYWIFFAVSNYHPDKSPANGLSFSSKKEDLGRFFNWHPFLMVTSLFALNFKAVSMFVGSNGNPSAKPKAKLQHMLLHFISLVLGFFGIVAVFTFHNNMSPAIPNMYSLHSYLGLTTYVMYIIQFVFGFVFFWQGYGNPLKAKISMHQRGESILYHRLSGVFILIGSALTILTGMQEKLIFTGSCNVLGSMMIDCRIALFACGLVAISLFILLSMVIIVPQKFGEIPSRNTTSEQEQPLINA